VPDYPATTLAKNKNKYYVLLTVPVELRPHLNGRKQLKKSTGTSDLADAKRRQHRISTELYAQLDACKPDIRDEISDHLGWIGDAEEIQRLDDEGHLEGIIMAHKYAEDTSDPDAEDDSCIDLVHLGGERAHEAYKRWKAQTNTSDVKENTLSLADLCREYLATTPYQNQKTLRECEHALEQFQRFMGNCSLTAVTAVKVHDFSAHVGTGKSLKLVQKKLGYVRRMFDLAVRKGWVETNVFIGIRLDKSVGTAKQSYIPFSREELEQLFAQEMKPHLKRLLSILVATGMRLDEAALLNWENIKHDSAQGITYFDLTEAIVKTKGSQRQVPVHSSLKWISTGKTGLMFPEFPRDRDGKTQASSSKALMPLVRNVTQHKSKVVHSLRGNFKDMLRDVGVSKEVNDFITGHGSGDVAGAYGAGPSLKVRGEAIERLSFQFLKLADG